MARSVRRDVRGLVATLPGRGGAHRLRLDAADRRSGPTGERADTREPECDRGHAREPRCDRWAAGADPRAIGNRDRRSAPEQHFEHADGPSDLSRSSHPRHRELNLNRSANLDYFETHVAVVAPHGETEWVFTTRRRVTAGRAVAIVGFPQLHATVSGDLPRIDVSSGGTAHLTVSNRSAVPQYDLQVYAVAVRAGRYVGAGRARCAHLGTGANTTLSITLLGGSQRATLRLIALPTIFS